jgi:ligand-binding SRPBCC domain-containing protein
MIPRVTVTAAGSDFELRAEQWVPQPVDRVFPFFADPYNLERITPGFLRFRVRNVSTPQVQEGTIIRYRLRLHGIPVSWRSRIDEWRPGERFVDRQIAGPYAAWQHTHQFVARDHGTLLMDTVRYRLRCAPLGRTPLLAWVHRDVRNIFEYRHRAIAAAFGRPADDRRTC